MTINESVDFEALVKNLLNNPADITAGKVLADFLDERNEQGDSQVAAALRAVGTKDFSKTFRVASTVTKINTGRLNNQTTYPDRKYDNLMSHILAWAQNLNAHSNTYGKVKSDWTFKAQEIHHLLRLASYDSLNADKTIENCRKIIESLNKFIMKVPINIKNKASVDLLRNLRLEIHDFVEAIGYNSGNQTLISLRNQLNRLAYQI